jgi:hypothetical protein
LPSKNPRAFGIDLHVDDSEGVKLEGKKYGFKGVRVTGGGSLKAVTFGVKQLAVLMSNR